MDLPVLPLCSKLPQRNQNEIQSLTHCFWDCDFSWKFVYHKVVTLFSFAGTVPEYYPNICRLDRLYIIEELHCAKN